MQSKSMSSHAVVLTLVLLLFPPHPRTSEEAASKDKYSNVYVDPEGYELMSRVLEKEATDLRLKNFNILNHSAGRPLCNKFPEEFQPAVDDLIGKSDASRKFERKFHLSSPYQLSYSGDFRLSEPGFDASRTHAAVHWFMGCGSLCGSGSTYLFRKTGDGWQLVDQVCEEVS